MQNGKSAIQLAYLLSHPIQYQSPLLKLIAEQPDIDLTVFYRSDFSVRKFIDPGVGHEVEWDVPLLEGYRYEFLPALDSETHPSLLRPINFGLRSRLKRGKFDVLWVHGYAPLYNMLAIIAAKSLGIRVMLRDEAHEQGTPDVAWRNALKRVYFAQLRRMVDAFLPIGTRNTQYFKAHGVPDERMFLMPYAVENERFRQQANDASAGRGQLRQSLCLEPDRTIFLYVGKLIERKRPLDLIQAFDQMSKKTSRQAYLLVAGDGEQRMELETWVSASSSADRIRFLGFVGQTELPAYYDLADVFVLPSRYEQWGLVVNEAMNASCAIVVSETVGSAADLVQQGANGRTYACGDVHALVQALLPFAEDTDYARKAGEVSQEIISSWSYNEDIDGLRKALNFVTSS